MLALLGEDLPYEVGDVGLTLHIEIDGNDRSATGEAFISDGNTHGVSYSGMEYAEDLIRDLAGAKSSVAMRVVDYSDNSDIAWRDENLIGLADGAAAFLTNCYSGPAVSVAEATTEVQASADWTFGQSVADVEAGFRGVMTARAADGNTLRMTCSLDAGTWTIGIFGQSVADPDLVGATILVDVDGLSWGPLSASLDSETMAGLVVGDATSVAELVPVFALAPDTIVLEVSQSDRTERYLFTAGQPAAAAASEMFGKCYAMD